MYISPAHLTQTINGLWPFLVVVVAGTNTPTFKLVDDNPHTTDTNSEGRRTFYIISRGKRNSSYLKLWSYITLQRLRTQVFIEKNVEEEPLDGEHMTS